jgi:hypothetical protein
MNYTQLQNDIRQQFAREDLPTDTFVRLAEASLNRRLRLMEMVQVVTATAENQTPAGEYYVTLPDDFLEVRDVQKGSVSLEFLDKKQDLDGWHNGYTVTNSTLLIAEGGDITLYYYAREPELSDTNQENCFTKCAGDLLFYLACVHAAAYMGMPDTYSPLVGGMVAELEMQEQNRVYPGVLVQRG